MTRMETRFMKNPDLTISGILKYPDPKTTAFGGVATGSMNAQEAAEVHATMTIKGSIPKATAKGAKTGSIMAVVAKLEVTSVKKLIHAMTRSSNANNGSPSKKVICEPI